MSVINLWREQRRLMENLYYALISALAGMVFTFIAMPFLLKYCYARGKCDMPGGRRLHKQPIPRLGGVMFMPALLIGLSAACLLKGEMVIPIKTSSVLLASGAILIYAFGFLDDWFGMRANPKFVVQLIAALIMPLCGLYINNFYGMFGLYELPFWFSYPLTVFIILLIVNSINLIDGIDGLASGLCICIFTVYMLLFLYQEKTTNYSFCIAGLIGSLLAFFYFNVWGKVKNRTKTFMGDSGSLILGYALAYLTLKYTMDPMDTEKVLGHRNYALFLSFTLLIVPTFDVIRVAFYRIFHKKPVFGADKNHIHHLIIAAGFTMHQALGIILGLFFFFCLLNYGLYACCMSQTLIVLIDVVLFCAFFVVLEQIKRGRKRAVSVTS